MSKAFMLSTIDNPFNPFEQFDDWFTFDVCNGYNCCSRLARLIDSRNDDTDEETSRMTEEAIDLLIRYDPFGLFVKVEKEIN